MSGQGGGVDYVKARRFFLMAADKKIRLLYII
ncbi:hypothetical protein PYX06_03740 [Citrobacter amalonaticus]|nr:hypothetical protein [Citrobacter amalonaticus]